MQGHHVLQHSFSCGEINIEPNKPVSEGSQMTIQEKCCSHKVSQWLFSSSRPETKVAGGSLVLAWQQLSCKEMVCSLLCWSRWSRQIALTQQRIQQGENLINCFQAVNQDPSIKCVTDGNLHSECRPWVEKHDLRERMKCTVNSCVYQMSGFQNVLK